MGPTNFRNATPWRTLFVLRFRKIMDVWAGRPSTDMIIAAVAVGIHATIVSRLHSGNVLAWANQAQRLGLYAAGAGMMALIAGFAGTAIAQYGSASGPVVSALRSVHGAAIRRNWLNITKWLLLSAVLCLVAMAIDGDKTTRGSEWVFEAALAISIAKILRLLFLFGLILSAVDAEPGDARSPERTQSRPPRR